LWSVCACRASNTRRSFMQPLVAAVGRLKQLGRI
jgi:hypothetical protein